MQIETSSWILMKDDHWEEIVLLTELDEDAELYVDNSFTV